MTKVHVRVQSIEDKLYEYQNANPVEIYIDYRDELSDEQVDKILEGKADDVRYEIEEYAMINHYSGEFDGYDEEMAKEVGCTQEDINDWRSEEGIWPVYFLDDHGWRTLLRNTSANIVGIVWDAEFNFYNWAYAGPVNYQDVKESLKILGINPFEFKKLCTGGSLTSGPGKLKGYFPDMPKREAKADIKELYDNMVSLYNGVMHFCFGDLENIAAILSDDTKNIVIKKGTNVVFYDRGNGAGISEVKLTGDVTIKRSQVEFRNDTNSQHGVQACYGFTNNYWTEGEISNAN